MTLPWIIGSAAVGVLAGPWIRSCTFFYDAAFYDTAFRGGRSPRQECPGCARRVGPRAWVLSVTGRCRACRARIGPYPLLAELTAAAAMAVAAARATSAWELAALAWLILLAVPLIFIDIAVHRLPNPLTAAAGAGVLALLAAAAFTGHHPGSLVRAVLGAAALTGFYLVLWLIRPGGMGLGDVKLSVSVGLVLAWTSWQALFAGTFLAFILAAGYGVVIIVMRKAGRGTQLPLGPFMLAGALAAIAVLPPGLPPG